MAGLTTGTAWAAGTVTVTSPSPAATFNTSVRSMTFSTSDPVLPSPAPAPTVTLSRNGVASDAIAGTEVTVASVGSVTASVDFRRANPGSYDVHITQGNFDDSCTACFTVLSDPVDVTSVTPNVLGEAGSTNSFVINGSNFAKGPYDGTASGTGASVALLLSGAATPTADPDASVGPTVDGSGQPAPTPTTTDTITLRLQLSNGAGEHFDDVVVTNTDGTSKTCFRCLEVKPQPTIETVTGPIDDASVGQNARGQQIVITGHDFAPDAHVAISPPSQSAGTFTFTQSAPVATPTDADPNLQQITLSQVDTTGVVDAGTGPANKWSVTVASPSLRDSSAASLLTVNPAPTATSITYDSGSDIGEGAQARHITVGGSGIGSGTRILFPADMPAGISPSNQQVAGGAVSAQVDVQQGSTEIGSYPIRLVNPDGGTSAPCAVPPPALPPGGTATPCPLVIAAGPTVTSVSSPTTVTPGYAGALTIVGTNLHTSGGVHVLLSSGNTTYYETDATAVDQGDGTQKIVLADGPVKVPADAQAGAADVTVTNVDDGGTRTAAGLLNVRSLAVTGVSPSLAGNSGPVTDVQVNGADFDPAATVRLQQGARVIPGTNVSVANPSTLTADFDLTDVAPGPYQVIVTNPQPSGPVDSNEMVVFDVVAPQPVIDTVSPAALGGGATDVAVVVTGDNFFPGSTVSFDNPSISLIGSPDISADRKTITQNVSVAPDASAGTSTVTVTNSALDQSNQGTIDVDPAPFVAGVTPSEHSPDAFPISVAGDGFVSGAGLKFDNPGVHADNVTVVAPDTITADLSFDPGVVPDDLPVDVAVTVVNPDAGQATTAQGSGLTLDPEPRVTSTSPSPALFAAGKSATLTLNGANFENKPELTTTASDVTISNEHFGGAGEFDATISVLAGAARGTRTLTLTNPDGGHVAQDITVYVAPGSPSIDSVTPGDRSLAVTWSAPTDNGGGALSTYTVTVTPDAGGAPTTFTASDASTTSHTFTGLTPESLYDVSVVATNGAGDGPAATSTGTPFTKPGAPSVESVTPGDGSLAVTWAAPADDGGNSISAYTVTLTPQPGGSTTRFTTPDATTTSHVFAGLANGTTYDVTVVASNAAGDSPAATSSGTPRTVPGAPGSLTVTPKDGELDLTWVAPADGGSALTGYTATVTPHAGGAATSHPLGAAATSDAFTDLTNGTLYDVTVVAHNAAGDSAAATATGKPRTSAGSPTALNVTPGDATLTVAWAAPASSGGSAVTGYTVTATPHAGGTATAFTTPDATTTSHTFDGLTNGTLYDVSVVANNAAGSGAAATGSGTPRFASTLSIADSARRVIDGRKITLSGVLTRSDHTGVGGAAVTVLRTFDGRTATRYLTTTTDATGHWTATFAPAHNATYAATFAGSSSVAPSSTGKARTTVAPRILIRSPLNKSTSSSATPLKVTGSVAPNKAGRVVTLYSVTRTGKLVRLAATHLSSKSRYAFKVALKHGAWRLRVVIGATPGNVAGRSGTISVRRT